MLVHGEVLLIIEFALSLHMKKKKTTAEAVAASETLP